MAREKSWIETGVVMLENLTGLDINRDKTVGDVEATESASKAGPSEPAATSAPATEPDKAAREKSWLQSGVDLLENVTGLDIDGDGTVGGGVAASAAPATPDTPADSSRSRLERI